MPQRPKQSPAESQYQKMCRQLSRWGCFSQGSVQDRTARNGGGAGYQWTRKVNGKTVTVALTATQFEKMKEATVRYRELRRHLKAMEALSRRIIFEANPHQARQKKLSQKVLGIK